MYSALSENHGNLNDKLSIFIALCPITNLHLSTDKIFTHVINKMTLYIFRKTALTLGINELLGTKWNRIKGSLNRVFPVDKMLEHFYAGKPHAFNDKVSSFIGTHRSLSAVSRKQLVHYAQTDVLDGFKKFDYGWWQNYKKYGRSKPPSLDLGNIQVPHAMFVGK